MSCKGFIDITHRSQSGSLVGSGTSSLVATSMLERGRSGARLLTTTSSVPLPSQSPTITSHVTNPEPSPVAGGETARKRRSALSGHPSVGVFWSARSARFAYFRVGADQAVMARRLDAAPAVEPLTGLPPDTQHVSKRN